MKTRGIVVALGLGACVVAAACSGSVADESVGDGDAGAARGDGGRAATTGQGASGPMTTGHATTGATTDATTGIGGAATTASTGATGGGDVASTGVGGVAVTTAAVTSTTGSGGSIPCAPAPVDLDQVSIFDNPPDLASWPITTLLTEVDFTNDGVHVDFDKEDGPSRWPDVIAPGFTGPLEYTMGIVECVDGQWATSAVIEFWNGLYAEGGNLAVDNQVAVNWYYSTRWGTLVGRQPATGETIGVFVAAGNLRDVTSDDPSESPVMERSNVVFMPMPDVNGSMNSF
jgi:hypothetical protein